MTKLDNKQKKIITFTVPIFYPGIFHIGTLTTLVAADICKRMCEVFGMDSKLLVGLDENSEKIVRKTQEENKNSNTPIEELVFNKLNYYANDFINLCKDFQISYDFMIRTTDDAHKDRVQKYWNILLQKQLIKKGTYKGYYSVRDETFFKQSELDENGLAPTGAPVNQIEQECYYLQTDILTAKVLANLNKDFVYPQKHSEIFKKFIGEKLEPLCISRLRGFFTFLGIKVPNDEKFCVYVWFDALLNYLAIGEDRWNGRVVQFIAKDIGNFHAIFFPAILAGLGLKQPDALVIHQWWLVDNKKMSKSLGNGITPQQIMDKYGVDPLRLFIFKNNLIAKDGQFSEEHLVKDFNTYAVNQLSNLLHRSWSVLYKNGIDIPAEAKTLPIETKLKEFASSGAIDKLFLELSRYTQQMNKEFANNELWNKTDELILFFSKVRRLMTYWSAVFPSSVKINWSAEPKKLFCPI